MKSIVFQGATTSDIQFNLEEIITNGFSPTLAIAFGCHTCGLKELPEIFTKKGIKLIGTSTAGEFTGEDLTEEQIVVMLLDIDVSAFTLFDVESDYANSFVSGKRLGQFGKDHFEDPAFILFFSMNLSGESLIAGINDEVSGTASVFGGMSGDGMRMKETFTFGNTHYRNNGVTALVIDNAKVEVKGRALCGWQPIGVEHQITSAKDNVIYSINDRPALEVVKQYFGDFYANTLEDTSAVGMGAAQYPLQLQRGDNNVLRATLVANEDDGSLMMAGPINKGDIFRFSVAPGFEVIDETLKGFSDYHKENSEADALILVSCVARRMSLGPLLDDEVTGIYNFWKKPLAGFFSYGEIGQHGTGTSYFYNETCSLILLKERN